MSTDLFMLNLQRADIAYNYKDYALVIQDCNLALKNFIEEKDFEADRIDAYSMRMRSYYFLKDYDNALKDAQEVLALCDSNYLANRIIAMCYYEQKDYENAINYFNIIIDKNIAQECNDAILLAASYYKLGRYEEAIEAYETAISFTDDNVRIARVYASMGQVYEAWKRYDDAERVYKKELETIVDADSYNSLAWFYYESKKDYQLALEYADKALICNPDFEHALDTRANVYCELNRLDEALADINKAIEVSQKSNYYETRVKIYKRMGKSDLAHADLEMAKSID